MDVHFAKFFLENLDLFGGLSFLRFGELDFALSLVDGVGNSALNLLGKIAFLLVEVSRSQLVIGNFFLDCSGLVLHRLVDNCL